MKNIDPDHSFIELAPSASSSIEGLRQIGYTLNTAIADIIDNSISANSTMICIIFNRDDNNPSLF